MTHCISYLASSFSLNTVSKYSASSNNGYRPSPTASLPVSTLLFSSFSQNFPRNGKLVSRKSGYYLAKPAEQDLDTREPSPEVSGENDGNTSTSFLSILCPLLRLFSVATSSLSTLARFPWGSRSLSESLESQDIIISDPPMRMQLFEFEACPFCRRVREALTELDLSVEVYPCPKGSLRHREMVRSFGGKEQFPFLIDPNSGISMYESGDIVKYLFKHYGKGRSPSMGLLESTLFTGWMPTILRAGRGMMLWDKARQDPPSRKLELFSYENNPVPYIMDPNTGTQIGDYKKILSYLFKTYSAATV
ncbi:uncharacterized protein LOC111287349 isoform X2 [Durio zibethinus]|uniref:Uncharacterized protein LOC111287349 isoform X2 n=1 Tax=Durio zibethinus TaxID=66656 RepID=A0A6P5XZJ7_DURZI|nr:uncharacterized protein LOC111287349 isoform X2 [Durio zibethinus]